mmetsp:Transcript_22846/g.44392  ORF Transcript_22846/g.44392 Transcript_22846/m.44392 type:complete len:246 (-) Transcript_22846:1163-1900(-)
MGGLAPLGHSPCGYSCESSKRYRVERPMVLALSNSLSGESQSLHVRCFERLKAKSNLLNALSSNDASAALSETLSLTRMSAKPCSDALLLAPSDSLHIPTSVSITFIRSETSLTVCLCARRMPTHMPGAATSSSSTSLGERDVLSSRLHAACTCAARVFLAAATSRLMWFSSMSKWPSLSCMRSLQGDPAGVSLLTVSRKEVRALSDSSSACAEKPPFGMSSSSGSKSLSAAANLSSSSSLAART